MTVQPAIPVGGIVGLRFLDQTFDRQFDTFFRSPSIAREVEYFRENAGNITTVDELIGDRRILAVVLGAFGLEEDLNKGAFIRKVIEEGTLERTAFANRLVDPAYRELSSTLGFGNFNGEGTLILESTRNRILADFQERRFETAVGEVDFNIRLALNFRREATEIAQQGLSPESGFLRFLATPPLRSVIEQTLLLPQQFGLIDLDQQVEVVQQRAQQLFGISDPAQFLEDGNLDRFVDRFLANAQIAQGVVGPGVRGATALTLLQSSSIGSVGAANLFASNFSIL